MRAVLSFGVLLLGAALGPCCRGATAFEPSPRADDSPALLSYNVAQNNDSLPTNSAAAEIGPPPLDIELGRAQAKGVYLVHREKAVANIVISLGIAIIYYLLFSGRAVDEARAEAPNDPLIASYARAFRNYPVAMYIDIFLLIIPVVLLLQLIIKELERYRIQKALEGTDLSRPR